MVEYKYGEWGDSQFEQAKHRIQKQIFFLLLIVDAKTKDDYENENINVNQVFASLMQKLGGMNSLLGEPPELVQVMCLLEAAQIEYNNPNFRFSLYRKLILDAGATVKKLEEV